MFESRFSIDDIIQGERGSANPAAISVSEVGQYPPMGAGTEIGGESGISAGSAYIPPAEEGAAFIPVPNLGFGASLGAVAYPNTLQNLTPGQQASLNQYLQGGPGQDYSFGIVPKIMGLLGAPTRYEQITSGDYRPVFVGDEFYGSFGAGPFGGQVYTGRTLPSDVAAEYGIPGFEDTSGDPTFTEPVTDALTGEQRCPDGYIFDEDLQACRLETTAPVAKALEQRTPTRTYSLLDQAPDGLLEFQRRYGLPQQQMDFSLLT
jgi:hypothetical protein